jgi:hypothetical protein
MRYLILLLVIASWGVRSADSIPALIHPSGAELVEQAIAEEPGSHLVVLGALEKINHEIVPEDSETIFALKQEATWYLPQSRRSGKVADHYRGQLEELGEILFECRGRACGSSSFWANQLLGKSMLYGPEQYQRYTILRLSESGDYFLIYIGQRATRKIYVHFVRYSRKDQT